MVSLSTCKTEPLPGVCYLRAKAKKSVSSGGSTQPTRDTRSNSGIVANLADLNKLGMPGMLESSEAAGHSRNLDWLGPFGLQGCLGVGTRQWGAGSMESGNDRFGVSPPAADVDCCFDRKKRTRTLPPIIMEHP